MTCITCTVCSGRISPLSVSCDAYCSLQEERNQWSSGSFAFTGGSNKFVGMPVLSLGLLELFSPV